MTISRHGQKEEKGLVTITLYCKEMINLYTKERTYNLGILKEKEKVDRIVTGLGNAAQQKKLTPPEYVVSVLLVPDWGYSITRGPYPTLPDKPMDNVLYLTFNEEKQAINCCVHIPGIGKQDLLLSLSALELKEIKEIKAGAGQKTLDEVLKAKPVELLKAVLFRTDEEKITDSQFYESNGYKNKNYLAKQEEFIKMVSETFEGSGRVRFVNALDSLARQQVYMEYLDHLKSMGSTADMIKTVALIEHKGTSHLQLDSNTVIPSYQRLYDQTFGCTEADKEKTMVVVEEESTSEAGTLNASLYDTENHYVTAHNKMVFIPAVDVITCTVLEKHLRVWCEAHKSDDADKIASKNSIYARAFTEAMTELKYVTKCEVNGKMYYPATLDPEKFGLTSCMVTAVNMSWGAAGSNAIVGHLKNKFGDKGVVNIGSDGFFDCACFSNVVKKYSDSLENHDLFESKAALPGDEPLSPKSARARLNDLTAKSRKEELKAAGDFYQKILDSFPDDADQLLDMLPQSDDDFISEMLGVVTTLDEVRLHAAKKVVAAAVQGEEKASEDVAAAKEKAKASTVETETKAQITQNKNMVEKAKTYCAVLALKIDLKKRIKDTGKSSGCFSCFLFSGSAKKDNLLTERLKMLESLIAKIKEGNPVQQIYRDLQDEDAKIFAALMLELQKGGELKLSEPAPRIAG